jgi:hypothetical protein
MDLAKRVKCKIFILKGNGRAARFILYYASILTHGWGYLRHAKTRVWSGFFSVWGLDNGFGLRRKHRAVSMRILVVNLWWLDGE